MQALAAAVTGWRVRTLLGSKRYAGAAKRIRETRQLLLETLARAGSGVDGEGDDAAFARDLSVQLSSEVAQLRRVFVDDGAAAVPRELLAFLRSAAAARAREEAGGGAGTSARRKAAVRDDGGGGTGAAALAAAGSTAEERAAQRRQRLKGGALGRKVQERYRGEAPAPGAGGAAAQALAVQEAPQVPPEEAPEPPSAAPPPPKPARALRKPPAAKAASAAPPPSDLPPSARWRVSVELVQVRDGEWIRLSPQCFCIAISIHALLLRRPATSRLQPRSRASSPQVRA